MIKKTEQNVRTVLYDLKFLHIFTENLPKYFAHWVIVKYEYAVSGKIIFPKYRQSIFNVIK